MKQLAFKEWKRGKNQLPIVVTGQDHPAGGCPPEYLDGFFCRFPLSLFISLLAWLNLNLLPVVKLVKFLRPPFLNFTLTTLQPSTKRSCSRVVMVSIQFIKLLQKSTIAYSPTYIQKVKMSADFAFQSNIICGKSA